MVVPLLLGATINTFFPQILEIGGFTTALFKQGAMPLIALSCCATVRRLRSDRLEFL